MTSAPLRRCRCVSRRHVSVGTTLRGIVSRFVLDVSNRGAPTAARTDVSRPTTCRARGRGVRQVCRCAWRTSRWCAPTATRRADPLAQARSGPVLLIPLGGCPPPRGAQDRIARSNLRLSRTPVRTGVDPGARGAALRRLRRLVRTRPAKPPPEKVRKRSRKAPEKVRNALTCGFPVGFRWIPVGRSRFPEVRRL